MNHLSINTDEYYYLEWPTWMKHLKEYGFDNMEISINNCRENKYLDELVQLTKQNKINVTAVNDWFHFFSPNDAKGIENGQKRLIEDLEFTKLIGSDKLIWYTGKNNKFTGEEAVNELLKRLEPVLRRAEELNIALLLETEFVKDGFDPAASIQSMKKLFTLADTPYLACNFDAANIYVAGEEAFPYAYEELKPWIKYIHLKDIRVLVGEVHTLSDRKGNLQEGAINATCCALGEGAINFSGIFDALKTDNYSGYFSMELHMKNKYQDETLKRSLEFLKRFC